MRMNMSIILDKVNYVYSEGTAYQIQALKDVNLTIEDGQFIGVIGHTGSGKSTLIQHLNGLMKANVEMNRKSLSELAISDADAFKALVDTAKKAL